jgi:hypothetical protein
MALSHQYRVASFSIVRVLSCLHSSALSCSCCNVIQLCYDLDACNLVTATATQMRQMLNGCTFSKQLDHVTNLIQGEKTYIRLRCQECHARLNILIRLWKCRQQVYPNHWRTSAGLHGVTIQKTIIWINTDINPNSSCHFGNSARAFRKCILKRKDLNSQDTKNMTQ